MSDDIEGCTMDQWARLAPDVTEYREPFVRPSPVVVTGVASHPSRYDMHMKARPMIPTSVTKSINACSYKYMLRVIIQMASRDCR